MPARDARVKSWTAARDRSRDDGELDCLHLFINVATDGLFAVDAIFRKRGAKPELRHSGGAAGRQCFATGDRPLRERARWIKHADFFIGLSSGLSWLAWSVGTPVVMISGFTHPLNEFATPYRVINYHACNSCWNDPAHRFDHKDVLWCPRQKGTPRHVECTRLITAEQVKGVIRTIPGFGQAHPSVAKPAR